jgi:hypothetical protein
VGPNRSFDHCAVPVFCCSLPPASAHSATLSVYAGDQFQALPPRARCVPDRTVTRGAPR